MGLSSKQVSSDVQDWNQDLLQSSSDNSGSGTTSMELSKLPMKRQQDQQQDQQHQQQHQQHQQQQHQQPEKLKCPRCDSTNTKFCYYNNYNKSQPRHFCKSCKRHWTKGGMLRNVPVGGGRKNKRLKTSTNSTITTNINNTKTAITANTNVLASTFGFQDSNQRLNLSLGLDSENSMRKMLNQAILGPQSLLQENFFNEGHFNGIFGSSSTFQNHDLQFPCPNFSSLDEKFSTSSVNISSLYGLHNGESNALEETIMTGLDHEKPWPSSENTSNWVWDDIDKFVSADVTIPWDDAEIN